MRASAKTASSMKHPHRNEKKEASFELLRSLGGTPKCCLLVYTNFTNKHPLCSLDDFASIWVHVGLEDTDRSDSGRSSYYVLLVESCGNRFPEFHSSKTPKNKLRNTDTRGRCSSLRERPPALAHTGAEASTLRRCSEIARLLFGVDGRIQRRRSTRTKMQLVSRMVCSQLGGREGGSREHPHARSAHVGFDRVGGTSFARAG